jgi:hypothetical protein
MLKIAMRTARLPIIILVAGITTAAHAQMPAAKVSPPVTTQPTRIGAAVTPAATPPSGSSAAPDPELVNQLLALLGDAVITRLDARVSLESVALQQGRVLLSGVSLKNLNVGLRLNARGTQRLASMLQQRYSGGPSASKQQWTQLLEIMKLGLFNQLEISVHLDELAVRQLEVDAADAEVEGLLVRAGTTPVGERRNTTRQGNLQTLMEILRRSALNDIQADAGIQKLHAGRATLELNGLALRGFSVGFLLARPPTDSPQRPE